MPCGVQHHFNDAFDMAIHWLKSADIHAETARDRRTHLGRIQLFALDLTAFDNVFGKRLENSLLLKRKAQGLHVAKQAALIMADRSQRFRKHFLVPSESGPVG